MVDSSVPELKTIFRQLSIREVVQIIDSLCLLSQLDIWGTALSIPIEHFYIAQVVISFDFNSVSAFPCDFFRCIASQFYLTAWVAVNLHEYVHISTQVERAYAVKTPITLSVALLTF